MSVAHREQIRQRLTELVGQKAQLHIEDPLSSGSHWDPCTILQPPTPNGYRAPSGAWSSIQRPGDEPSYRIPVRWQGKRKTFWLNTSYILDVEEGW
jgi:hypothetical protein